MLASAGACGLLRARHTNLIIWSCCRLSQGCDTNDDILRAALGGDLPGKVVMLQSSGSFFAYEPILKALQTTRSMPLAEYIASPKLVSEQSDMETARSGGHGGPPLLRGLLQHGSRLFGHQEQSRK